LTPDFWVARLFGGVGFVVTRKLSFERPVVSVLSGEESSMFVQTKRLAAPAVTFWIVTLFSNAAYPQSTNGPNLPASGIGLRLQHGPEACAKAARIEPLRQRLRFTSPSWASPSAPSVEKDTCGRMGGVSAALRSGEERVQSELLAMGKRGETIARVRELVLQILESKNTCAAWFQEVEPDPAGNFRSLQIKLDENGRSYVDAVKEIGQPEVFKHPYVAESVENAGRDATIQLNANGAFFQRSSPVLEQAGNRGLVRDGGMHELRVDSYSGNTRAAQITTLLHELGHIVGRLPEDNDSWDGKSVRNTAEVLRYCRAEINSSSRKPSPGNVDE
jgi:hypothetical protein